MANGRYRSASIYAGGAKVGTINKFSLEMNSNSEAQYGDSGIDGYSDGITMSKLSADGIVPYAGTPNAVSLLQSMLDKGVVNVAVGTVDGKIFSWPEMRVTSVKYDSDSQKGTMNSSYTIEGGAPIIT